MSATFTIDSRQFDQALVLYRQASRRDLAYIINRAAMNVAFKAIELTPKADPGQIEAQLQRVVAVQIAGKTGKLLKRNVSAKTRAKRNIYGATRLGQNIVLARMHRAGRNIRSAFPSRGEIDDAVRKMVSARKSSTGFIRSGWFKAAGILQTFLKGSAPAGRKGWAGVKDFGGDKGSVRIASNAINYPVAIISNKAVNEKNRTSAAALVRVGNPPLGQAISIVAADMRGWAQARLAATAKKFSAK